VRTEKKNPTKEALIKYLPAFDLSRATSLVIRCEKPKEEIVWKMKKREMAIENLPKPETPKERATNNTNIKEHTGSVTWANNTVPVFLTNLLTVFIHLSSKLKTKP